MNLKDNLEIILITYNRKQYLMETFDQIFADNSPIKDLQITILDNKSTDGTTEYISEFIKDKHNVKHIVHNRNIGGNGNIARAFEIASKKYVWVLCDDDAYDWTYWSEIEQALEDNYDAVFTLLDHFEYYINDASIFRAATFLPAVIYKTELITGDVMQNAMASIINLFPHLSVMSEVINENKRIFIPEHSVVKVCNRIKGSVEEGFYRGANKSNVHPYVRDMFFIVGFINSVQMIKDKKKRTFILNHMSAKNTGFYREVCANFKRNRLYYNNSLKNTFDILAAVNFFQKIQFLIGLIWLDIVFYIKKFILRQYKYRLKS